MCASKLRGNALLNIPGILGCARKGEETEGGRRARESSPSCRFSLLLRSSRFLDRSGRIAISLICSTTSATIVKEGANHTSLAFDMLSESLILYHLAPRGECQQSIHRIYVYETASAITQRAYKLRLANHSFGWSPLLVLVPCRSC